MSTEIIVQKNRTNYVTLDLGIDITGETITSQIRSEPEVSAPLLAEWVVTVTDALTGKCLLTLDNTFSGQIVATSGFMDINRLSGTEPLAVFDQPLEVAFRGTVTE